jgi:hypothetical protein
MAQKRMDDKYILLSNGLAFAKREESSVAESRIDDFESTQKSSSSFSEVSSLNNKLLLNKELSYKSLDKDGLPINESGGGRVSQGKKKDNTLLKLQNRFITECKRQIGITPVMSTKNLACIKFATNSGGLTSDDIEDMIEEWFTLPDKTDEQLVQMSQMLSANQINNYKVRNNIKS